MIKATHYTKHYNQLRETVETRSSAKRKYSNDTILSTPVIQAFFDLFF